MVNVARLLTLVSIQKALLVEYTFHIYSTHLLQQKLMLKTDKQMDREDKNTRVCETLCAQWQQSPRKVFLAQW